MISEGVHCVEHVANCGRDVWTSDYPVQACRLVTALQRFREGESVHFNLFLTSSNVFSIRFYLSIVFQPKFTWDSEKYKLFPSVTRCKHMAKELDRARSILSGSASSMKCGGLSRQDDLLRANLSHKIHGL